MAMRLGVLASGSGSNFEALARACQSGQLPAELALLACNVPGAACLARAERLGVPAQVVDHRAFASREAFEAALVATLRAAQVDWVCLAGFMRLLGPTLLSAYPGKILNVHPSLLPAFPGLRAIEQALAYRAAVTGVTVHVVDAGTDTGPILLQAAVPVTPSDTAATLAAKLHAQEHRLYVAAVALLAEGRLRVSGRTVTFDAPDADGAIAGPVAVS